VNSPNLFLASLSPTARAALLHRATIVNLPADSVLYEAGTQPVHTYFLLSGLASIVTVMKSGDCGEVSLMAGESVIGALHLLGPARLPTRCKMLMAGSALRISFSTLQTAFAHSQEVHNRVLQFVQMQAATVTQLAGCSLLHTAEQRILRWLLMAEDRISTSSLTFTHELIAEMIGVQRSTVSLIAGELQRRGLIRYSRGKIHILDRPLLEASTCGCYPVIRSLHGNLYDREFAMATAS